MQPRRSACHNIVKSPDKRLNAVCADRGDELLAAAALRRADPPPVAAEGGDRNARVRIASHWVSFDDQLDDHRIVVR